MHIKKITSLKLSRKLKANGYKQEGENWWIHLEPYDKDDPAFGIYHEWELFNDSLWFSDGVFKGYKVIERVVAPTTIELTEADTLAKIWLHYKGAK